MMRTLQTLAALLGLVIAPTLAADPPKVEGDWEGFMKVSDTASLLMVFHIKKGDDGKLTATCDSPNQASKGVKVSGVTLEKNKLTMTVAANKGEFAATLSDEGSELKGEWNQGGKALPLTLTRPSTKPESLWEGDIKIQAGLKLKIVLRVRSDKDGKLTGRMDSPDQNATGFKVDTVTIDKTTLEFTVKTIAGEFSGKLNEAGTEAVGEWKQAGAAMPLTMKKTDKVSEARRTQMPKGPFPYQEIEVSYPNAASGNSLAGTLTLPKGDGPFPVVILITGSGAQDRDETLMGHKPFLVLADYLTRRGIGVLRVDDRGVGGSTGDHGKATSADFATDVQAGIEYVKTRKDVNAKKIGLMGHSEGGLIAPMVAAKNPDDVAFIVLLAGPGVPGNEILVAQSALIGKAMGGKDEEVAKQVAIAQKMYAEIRTGTDEAAVTKALQALGKEAIGALSPEDRKKTGDAGLKLMEAQIKMIQTPWFRYFLTYDPRPTLAKVKCPVLAVNGEKDLQVPPKQNLPEIEKAVKSGGNDKVTVREFRDLNHLFQTSKTGTPAEYAQIEETFNPDALMVIGDWIAGLK
ncbi:MAG: X-Pro dipeptidyl-peptidase family [Planctomycetota bacterium]|nr:X-Pro dipeptidyl-peptidase family [Planctomycetota bacterium]